MKKATVVLLLSFLIFPCLSACSAKDFTESQNPGFTKDTALTTSFHENHTTDTTIEFEETTEEPTQEEFLSTTSLLELTETTAPSITEYRRSHTAMDQILGTQTFGSVYFGTYEQDMNFNTKDPIEWMILKKEDNRALLISKYVLDWQPLSTDEQRRTWDDCSLRVWLNNDFYNVAFSNEEKEEILNVHLENAPFFRDEWSLWGEDTNDSVFLISYQEAEEYFPSDNARCAYPTPYAVWMGAVEQYYGNYQGTTRWFLREPGSTDVYGVPSRYSTATEFFHYNGNGIRPAIWINLEP